MVDVARLEIQVDTKGVAGASQQLDNLSGKSKIASSGLKLLGGALAAIGAGNVLSKITSDTMGFTKSVSELSAITGATGKDLEFYEKQAALIGSTTTLSASQAADAFKLIASAKPDLLANAEALAAVTKEAVTLAEAAGIGLADAANVVGVSLNQFGAEADQANRFVNVLAAGAKEGSSSITDTAQAMKNAGVAASLAGLSFEEANVGVQLLAKGGLFAAEAGTGFRQVLLKLENEADDKFKPSMVGLAGALENLSAEQMTLTELTDLFGAEAMKSAAVMIAGAGDARRLESAITDTSTATEMAETNFDNLTGDLLSLNSANEGLAISLGKKLEPWLRKTTKAATEFARKVDQFVRSQKFTRLIELLKKGMTALTVVIGLKAVVALRKYVVATLSAARATGIANTAAKLLRGTMAILGGPITIVIGALWALYEIIKKVFGINFDDYIAYFKGIAEVTKKALQGIMDIWTPSIQYIADLVKGFFKYFVDFFSPLITKFFDFWKTLGTAVFNFYKAFFTATKEAMEAFINFFKSGFVSAREFIEITKAKIIAFYETMKTKASSFFDSQEETERKLAEIDRQRTESLASITTKYNEQRDAGIEINNVAETTDGVWSRIGATVTTVKNSFDDFQPIYNDTAATTDTLNSDLDSVNTNLQNVSGSSIDAAESTNTLNTNLNNVNTSLGNINENSNTLVGDEGSLSSVTTEMSALTDNTVSATDAISGEAGLTVAQQSFTTMVENTQTAWGSLIKDTITNGKTDFKTFFTNVKDGFATMVSEIGAKKITDAIFGPSGVNGFLTGLSSGFGSIISSIASGLGSVIKTFASKLTGLNFGGGGSTAGNVATSAATSAAGGSLASIGTSIAAAMASPGQFISGMMGTAVGTSGSAMVGPPTAAAMSGMKVAGFFKGITGKLATLGSKTWSFITGPVGMSIAAIAIAAKLLDKSGTMSHNAGMFTQDLDVQGSGEKFGIDPFASGAQFYGFTRRSSTDEAMQVVNSFRDIDEALTDLARKSGLSVNLSASDFIGYSEKGKGIGAFFGSASEDGGGAGTPLEEQHLNYAKRWLTLVAGQNNVSPELLARFQGAGNITSLADMLLTDGSHALGINSIPFDGYIAELHKGERVLTANEAQKTDAMMDEIITLRGNLNELMLVVAKAVNKTARIEQRWDINGLPPTRS